MIRNAFHLPPRPERGLAVLLIAASLGLIEFPARAAAPDSAASSNSVHTVARAVAKNKTQLDGVFEAAEMQPIKIETSVWTDLTVLEAVPHGTQVHKGEVLVKLETEKLDDQIKELEQDRLTTAMALEVAGAELENLQQTTPLKLESTKRAQRIADEDYDYFVATARPQREKGAAFGVRSSEQRLEGANEELAQLEKMYKADDLTEETEEIILKRQRFGVQSAQYGLELAQISAARELKTSLPRENENLRSQKRDQELALALAETTLPRALTKKQMDVDKAKRDQKKTEKKLADLKKDRNALGVRAPMGGTVYYGACESGRWTTGASVAKKLLPTGKLSPNEVFITLVNPDKLFLRTVVPESELSNVRAGLPGKVSPVSAPDRKLSVKVEEIGYLPLPGGGFEARISVEKEEGVRLMPGMNGKITFGDTGKVEALVVPKDAVFGEGADRYVFLAGDTGKSAKRVVKIGSADGKMLEILEGLSEGDKILLSKPQ